MKFNVWVKLRFVGQDYCWDLSSLDDEVNYCYDASQHTLAEVQEEYAKDHNKAKDIYCFLDRTGDVNSTVPREQVYITFVKTLIKDGLEHTYGVYKVCTHSILLIEIHGETKKEFIGRYLSMNHEAWKALGVPITRLR